ncbi:MAG: error-prone DNA polymerase [Sphingobacteriales bacterium SCN 48-20]|uniref:error-prone DNA polymerase n=1 Tax=Terrimonas ferruginea TaxID=249 RepID=UPI00086E2DF4|nr:error-prone DNA polymerase [Terrimonas ferruginea]MBN8783564.1 error-prone DNA polymerase [Terrimonas ferruginea]ODT92563.1 MAG: error-prone DNA polymerase [Sphingobacteriales bacterium SCN 48-20]OJW40316.1 MAG: error-prone DNA polymerase [Sphingobacteriales bacterium 48-107]
MNCYSELQTTSNFSFLRGASHPEEMIAQAAALGYTAIAITDRNTLAGIVRAHVEAKKKGIKFIPAARLDLRDGPSLLAYPTNKYAYARLCALLSKGNLRTEKGQCELYKKDVYEHAEGMKLIVVPPDQLDHTFNYDTSFVAALEEYRSILGRQLYLAAARYYQGDDLKKMHRLWQLSQQYDLPLVAVNDVHYHEADRRELQDILTCVREKCTIYDAGFRLHANAERYLKPVEEMQRLYRQYPDAIERANEIAEACTFSLNELKYEYPAEITDGQPALERLIQLTWEGARRLFGAKVPGKIVKNIQHEMTFVREMNYAPYFLTVADIVREARSRGILCQGRGSAANSTICYCLGITSVDPTKFDLLFERFISSARNEPPDIDVDFEHERREEMIQYVYDKYGRDRAAIVATVTQQHQKGALRDVGKAMGLSPDLLAKLSGLVKSYSDEWYDEERLKATGLSSKDQHLKKVLQLTRQMMGFPRQLGQHTGGFVITQGKLTELCPLLNARMENRINIEWNKDDIDALGFMKVDVLALGMLTCIRKTFDLLKQHYGIDHTLASIPQDDPKVYEMISHADTIGVFQIESRAQQSMLPRLRPKCFYDLVIEVAIVRPGPIQGDMVHPYLRRRDGLEKVEYPSEDLRKILKDTLGVPLFQEQAMKIAIVAAGFTPAEADELRRSMATFKAHGKVSAFEQKLISGMMKKGYKEDYAKRVFRQLEGFGSYGFPESHAVSFALLVYISSWIKCYYPDVFAAAILNSMPMGFYQPAQLVIDARKHGVTVREVDVNHSYWNNTLEEQVGAYKVLRLGFRQVKGLREDDMEMLTTRRGEGYRTVGALCDAGVPVNALERLAEADAFRSMGMDRRAAMWQVAALTDHPEKLFAGQASETEQEPAIALPQISESEQVVRDYGSMGLSIKAHPVSFVREKLELLRIRPAADLEQVKDKEKVKVAGLVLVRQRPGTASGVCFVTLEDETGVVNAVVFANLFERDRKEILQAKLLMIEGRLQREGEVVHIIAERCHNITRLMAGLVGGGREDLPVLTLSRADENDGELPDYRKDVRRLKAEKGSPDVRIPEARNFK